MWYLPGPDIFFSSFFVLFVSFLLIFWIGGVFRVYLTVLRFNFAELMNPLNYVGRRRKIKIFFFACDLWCFVSILTYETRSRKNCLSIYIMFEYEESRLYLFSEYTFRLSTHRQALLHWLFVRCVAKIKIVFIYQISITIQVMCVRACVLNLDKRQ